MTALRNNLKRRVARLEAMKREEGQQRRWWKVEYDANEEEPVLQLDGNEPLPRLGETIFVLPANYRRAPGSSAVGTWKMGRHIPPGSGPVIPLSRHPTLPPMANSNNDEECNDGEVD